MPFSQAMTKSLIGLGTKRYPFVNAMKRMDKINKLISMRISRFKTRWKFLILNFLLLRITLLKYLIEIYIPYLLLQRRFSFRYLDQFSF